MNSLIVLLVSMSLLAAGVSAQVGANVNLDGVLPNINVNADTQGSVAGITLPRVGISASTQGANPSAASLNASAILANLLGLNGVGASVGLGAQGGANGLGVNVGANVPGLLGTSLGANANGQGVQVGGAGSGTLGRGILILNV